MAEAVTIAKEILAEHGASPGSSSDSLLYMIALGSHWFLVLSWLVVTMTCSVAACILLVSNSWLCSHLLVSLVLSSTTQVHHWKRESLCWTRRRSTSCGPICARRGWVARAHFRCRPCCSWTQVISAGPSSFNPFICVFVCAQAPCLCFLLFPGRVIDFISILRYVVSFCGSCIHPARLSCSPKPVLSMFLDAGPVRDNVYVAWSWSRLFPFPSLIGVFTFRPFIFLKYWNCCGGGCGLVSYLFGSRTASCM